MVTGTIRNGAGGAMRSKRKEHNGDNEREREQVGKDSNMYKKTMEFKEKDTSSFLLSWSL